MQSFAFWELIVTIIQKSHAGNYPSVIKGTEETEGIERIEGIEGAENFKLILNLMLITLVKL